MYLYKLVSKGISLGELEIFCREHRISLTNAFNLIAYHFATHYIEEKYEFDFCNHSLSRLWGIICTIQHSEDDSFPELAFEIYEAFCEGEYIHEGDSRIENPILKYVNPLVKEIIAKEPFKNSSFIFS